MRVTIHKFVVGIIGVATMMVGCAITPETKQSLIAYTTAMQQVQVATNRFLIDFSSAEDLRKQLEQTLAGDVANSYPATYDPRTRSDVPIASDKVAIQARRSALAAVAAYNDALVALAEGQSEVTVSAHLKSFGGGIGSVLDTIGVTASPFAAALPLASKLVTLIQDGLNKEEFTEALNLGQPIVEAILAQLESDTTQYYELSVQLTEMEHRDKVKKDMKEAVEAIKRLASRNSTPTEPDLKNEVRQIERKLHSIGVRTATLAVMPDSLPFEPGKPRFNQQALGRMETSMMLIESIARRDAEIVAKQNAYYDLMDAYVATLRQTNASLLIVRASLDRPGNFNTQAGRLLDVALNLRDALNEYRAAR